MFKDDEDSFLSNSITTSPKQQQHEDDGKDKEKAAASGQPSKSDYNFTYSRRQSWKKSAPNSALMVPNALTAFGPTTTVEPPHLIRERMMTRHFKNGLGLHVNWERRESRRTVRAFEERDQCRQRRQIAEGGPSTGGDDADYLEETTGDDREKGDNAWDQFDPLDYHARGW